MATLDLLPASSDDYRRLAEKRLPESLFDYIDGGAYDEVTLAANVEDFKTLQLQQRVMRDVSSIDTSIELLGESWDMPLALAPVGLGGMMARRAEVQAKKAADACGVGVNTLLFTVDLAVVGARYRDVRNGMAGGVGAWGSFRAGLLSYLRHPRWLLDVGIRGTPHVFGNLTEFVPKATTAAHFKSWVDEQFDPSVTWKDIEWLRSIWDGKLLIKGVLSPEDALSAANTG